MAAKLGVTARLGAEATRRCLLDAADPVVLHVAGHGAYNPQDPLLSRLELADGAVTVEDLLTSGPAPSLLVLSGCVTGISGRRPGDELIGLAQAALRNGTRSLVATLWETFDESSAVFFEHFYDALTEGESVSTAIAAGRYALSTDPRGYDHPVDWAPFLLIGDPNQRIVDPDHTPQPEPAADGCYGHAEAVQAGPDPDRCLPRPQRARALRPQTASPAETARHILDQPAPGQGVWGRRCR